MNKILIELEIKNVRVFYEEKIQLPAINPADPFNIIGSRSAPLIRLLSYLILSRPW